MKDHSLQLLHYNRWATSTIYDHLRKLPAEKSHQQIKSVFPSVFDVLVHVYIIDSGWHSVLSKEYASDDYEAIRKSIDRLVQETRNNTLDELAGKHLDLLDRIATLIATRDKRTPEVYSGVPMTLADVVLHLVNHGTYHRGNISAMLHQVGYASVPTDYGFYLYTSATT